MPVQIIGCTTIREESGLAFSSRNNRLSQSGRLKADTFASIFHAAPSCTAAIQLLRENQIEVEYIEEINQRRFAAVFIEGIRLIDNYCI